MTNEELSQQIAALTATVTEKFNEIDKRFEQIDKRLEHIDTRFEGIDGRLDKLQAGQDDLRTKYDSLKAGQDDLVAKHADWTAGRVSDSPESGLSGCLSCCSVLLVDLVGRPVPQGGVELSLIVCSSSIQEAISRMALLLVGYTI